MRLFVTGLTGHTGSFFIERLIREQSNTITLRALVRECSDTSQLDDSGLPIEKVIGDLQDIESIKAAMQGCDMILHIASIYQSDNVITAAKQVGIKKAILVHTTGRFSKYKSASAEYIAIEDNILAKKGDMELVILRPTMIYGTHRDRNMIKLVDYLYRHKFFPIFGKGQNLMQPVHAQDLGNAYYDVITHWAVTRNKCYNLSGGNTLPYIDLIDTVAGHLGKKISKVKIPIGLSLLAARLYNALFKGAIISVEQVQRMMEDKDFGYEEAAKDFGYAPVSFSEGIQDEVEQYLVDKEAGN